LIEYHASDGKSYATAKEAKEASQQLPTPAQTVYTLVMQAVFNCKGVNENDSKR
jgi:hypothetical protein